MKTYGQYCPIARASEVLAERWTPIILRNLLLGSTTFSEIAAGAPGLSRTLLTTRLRELERAGVVQLTPNPTGRRSHYQLTEAGEDLADVMKALGTWGERWMELAPEHLDPGVVLHSWVSWYLALEHLPERRVVARFQFPGLPRKGAELWVVFDGERSEVCRKDPGFEVELFVQAEPGALAEWHLGRIEWADALRAERIRVLGPSSLARALPTWNRRSAAARARPELGSSARDVRNALAPSGVPISRTGSSRARGPHAGESSVGAGSGAGHDGGRRARAGDQGRSARRRGAPVRGAAAVLRPDRD